jgi:hypothetical protein
MTIIREQVINGIPFGTSFEKEALRKVRDLGFTSVQIYSQWRTFENKGRGLYDWSELDRQVESIQQARLKYVPFLLMGPYYAEPDWWLNSPDHVGLRCLEHGKDCPIESIWNKAFYREIDRVTGDFAAHYLPWNVIESVQPGICGDYGEAIFPVLGNWPGTYHTHRGYWCGGEDAAASFRVWLERRYGSLDLLNKSWRVKYSAFAAIRPQMPCYCPSRTAIFDLIEWYRSSMTDYSEIWMDACRRAFPDTPLYLCTGGADDDTTSGAQFAQQAKVAGKYHGGIRLTNEGNTFDYNFPLTSHTHAACNLYGAYLGLEPVGPLTREGVGARIFGSAAMGNRQIFHYYHNLFDGKTHKALPSVEMIRQYSNLVGEKAAEEGIAYFWPVDQATLDGSVSLRPGLDGNISTALRHIRRNYPVQAISEEMILDGALSRFRCLVMLAVSCTRTSVLERIAQWVEKEGGILLSTARTCDIELKPVPAFDATLGITPKSEEAWGHHEEEVKAPSDFPRVAELKEFHAEKGWLHLAPEVETFATAKPGIGSSGVEGLTVIHPACTLFRRRSTSGGQAVFYGGNICFTVDPQQLFYDPQLIVRLLDDVCSQSGVKPLETQGDEVARARIGKQLLILREGLIEIQPLKDESSARVSRSSNVCSLA